MQTPSSVGLEFHPGSAEDPGPAASRSQQSRRTPPSRWTSRVSVLGFWALVGGGLLGTGCGLSAAEGDCGSFLSSAECHVVRTQLGTLSRRPPPDPTNRFGRCVNDNSAECIAEDAAAKLGQRLFFDRCLSVNNNVACVTCHQPAAAFTDNRIRELKVPVPVLAGGVALTMQLPPIKYPTPERVTMPPPMVEPLLDDTGTPLAKWISDNNGGGQWAGVMRRPTASLGSAAGSATGRHSPGVYNLAYGGGFAAMNGERTYGVTWTPWDGRYDSTWALVADVWEFGATHSTDRSHIAIRIGQNQGHRLAYEAMIGGPLFDFEAKTLATDGTMKYVYLRHGSPGGNACWYSGKQTDCVSSLPATDVVRANINEVFVNAGKALGAYMRRLRSNNAPYDRWIAGDPAAMSVAAQRGLRLFIGKAECIMCHNGPNFTDWRFHNLGVPSNDPEQKLAGSVMPTAPETRSSCFDGIAATPFCADTGRQAWQPRAAGTCVEDSADFHSNVSRISTVGCQRVDQPAVDRFDLPLDCRGPASDAADKDTQCLPASMADAKKCAFADAGSCGNSPLCQWVEPKPRCAARLPTVMLGGCLHSEVAACIADPLCRWVEPKPRCAARSSSTELGQFKTPSLRNVALTFPYMHNGMLFDYGPAERLETTNEDPTPHLLRVIEFYNSGGGQPDTGTLDPLIHPLNLAKTEMADLVEFLKALTDNSMATSSDPLTLEPADLAATLDCPAVP